MKSKLALLVLFCLVILPVAGLAQTAASKPKIAFVIHGGAGVIKKGTLEPKREAEFRQKLEEAVLAGYKALQSGKSSLDAVEVAIRIMEDSPLFNAGKGAVFTADGRNELDASIMEGKGLNAGAVAGLQRIKNPISLARKVMEKSPHVMMIGDGAEKFAKEQGIEFVSPKYFWTKHRWDILQEIIKEEKAKSKSVSEFRNPADRNEIYGTVGAVALDASGNLAAGTSTGGMTYKKYGRVGDAPILGAGTYADNRTCGVSATGWGEYFIRLSVARDISALMEYKGVSVQEAVDTVIQKKLQDLGGDGGVVALDKNGNVGISFNSEGMYRAYIGADGKPVVQIYKD